MGERLWRLLVKEFIQLFRDPRTRMVVLLTPVLQIIVLGYAVTTDVTDITTAVVDLDRSSTTREIVRRFEASGYFRVVYRGDEASALARLLDGGQAKVGLQFDPGFTRDLARRRPAAMQVVVDGTDSNSASVVQGYVNRIVTQYNREVMGSAMPTTLELRARAWFNPDLRSQSYYVPGIIAILTMLTSLLLTSMSIVREREIGTMEQLLVTPIRPAELILGKTIPFALVGFFDVAMITVMAVAWFDVPIRGSLLLLFGATALYLLSGLGVGLFISTISTTQQQALMSTFLFFQPAMLLSGFVFPIANMPDPIQVLTYANPIRYYLVVIRGVFLKGVGLEILWPELLALLVLGTAVFGASTWRFRKRLE